MELRNVSTGSTKPSSGNLGLVLAWTTLAAGIYIAVSTVVMVVTAWSLVPFGDQWDNLISTREVTWSWLIAQHNEHRILIPRLVFLADRWLSAETNVIDFAINVVAQGALAFLLVVLANESPWHWRTKMVWTIGLSLTLLFWAAQYENFVWGFQVAFFLVSLAATSAFAAMTMLSPNLCSLGLVLILEALAVYTNANGIVVPFLMVPLAMALRRSRIHVTVLAVSAVALLASYMVHYRMPSGHSDPTDAWRHIGTMVRYVFAELGGPFGTALERLIGIDKIKAAIRLGGLATLLFAVVGWRTIRRPGASASRDLVLLAIACFVFGTAVLTAMGRAERFGIGQALSSRYGTPVLLFWFCLIVLTAGRFRHWRDSALVAIMAATIPVLAIVAISQSFFVQIGKHWASERRAIAPVLLAGIPDLELLEKLFPVPERIRGVLEQRDLLKRAHTSVFAEEWGYWLGTPIEAHVTLVDPAGCQGGFDLAEVVATTSPRGWRAYGHAQDLSLRKPAAKILLVDNDGRIVGFGIDSREPATTDDVMAASTTAAHDAWIGSFQADDTAGVRAYALINQGRSACSLGMPRRVVDVPEVELVHDATPLPSPGGFVDNVDIGQDSVTVSGWGMLSPIRAGQRVGIDTNLPVASITMSHVPRPDVVAERKDEKLANSGFNVVLHLKSGAPTPPHVRLCVVTSDSVYGSHTLQIPFRPELCGAPPQQVVDVPEVELVHGVTPLPSPGGFVDKVEIGQDTVTVSGWGMLSSIRADQRVGIDTNLPVSSVTMSRVPRPDVVAERKDEGLASSGITVVLHLKSGAPIPPDMRLCVVTSDPEYGSHTLAIPSRPELCGTPPQQVVDVPEVELVHGVTPLPSPGGFVDKVEIGQDTVTVSGWGMLSPIRADQRVGIDTNLPVVSATTSRFLRPDVIAERKDKKLASSGIKVVLHLKSGAPIPPDMRLCVITSDPEYGSHTLAIPSRPELCPASRIP